MASFRTLVLLLFTACISSIWAWDISNENDRQICQSRTRNPLDGCEGSRTVFVDGLGNGTRFRSVQSDTYTILIASGNYTEQVNVTRRGPTYLLGQTSHPKDQSYNTVNIIWAAVAGTGDNAYTSTLTVAPTLNASLTGMPSDTPFGCVDFRTYNLNFINDYAPYSVTPSLALSISRANGGFYYTGFYSYQDTIYVGKLGNAYFKNGEVAGQTDFFYGFGTAWVEKTSIALRSCGGGITAWKGSNTTFINKYGVYIVDSNVHAANSSLNIVGKCALGRPWASFPRTQTPRLTNERKQNAQMRAIFARTYLDNSILSTGYIDWVPARYTPNLTLQAEYKNYGPGYNVSGRASALFDVQLTDRQWAVYDEPGKVFQTPEGRFGNTGWIDWSV
ncbi:putative pectinesterase A [Lachnellula hyalina]|uniref:pectinesterase n=1 Tax=Lachnellula hyalina TaxID=1316788 RepID=A0A8H8R6L8_9HELO|nr:putative pectinesterase A [Lachnellula hyalina]TVY29419.1 putative pectinesterase A [Lachnellula hyalina]